MTVHYPGYSEAIFMLRRLSFFQIPRNAEQNSLHLHAQGMQSHHVRPGPILAFSRG